jgi:hypothetical protein
LQPDSKMETDQRIAMLKGKIIGITGKIELHKGSRRLKSRLRIRSRLRFSAGAVIAPTFSSVKAFIKLHLLLAAK